MRIKLTGAATLEKITDTVSKGLSAEGILLLEMPQIFRSSKSMVLLKA